MATLSAKETAPRSATPPPAVSTRPSSSLTAEWKQSGAGNCAVGMMALSEKVGLSAMDLLSGRRLQGGIMGYNRFPVDIPRLVDFYQRGQLDLDTIIAERLPLTRINDAFDELRKGDATRSVIVFDQ